MALLLENALTLSDSIPYSFERKNILIQENIISKISKSQIICKDAQKIDCSKKIAIAGLVNAHTHTPMSLLRGRGDDLCLNDWLNKFTWPYEAKMSGQDIYIGAMLAISEMIHCGITCFNENYFHMDFIANAVEKSKIRACLGYSMIDRVKYEKKAYFDFDGKGERELKIAKDFAKRWQNKSNKKISTSICPHSVHTCSPQLLTRSSEIAKQTNSLLHIHCSETKEELKVCKKIHKLTPVLSLKKYNCLSKRTVLAHGIYVNHADITAISKSGVSVCTCPVSNMKLASGSFAPIVSYLKNSVNLCIGTDGASSNNSLSVFESMKFGAISQKNAHENASIVSADDYFSMGTLGGAKALHINSGSLCEGKLADITLLDANCANLIPFQNNAGWLIYSAGSHNVSDVIVDGQYVMQDKKILTFDEQSILDSAQKVVNDLIAK